MVAKPERSPLARLALVAAPGLLLPTRQTLGSTASSVTIGNIYYAGLAGLVLTTAATHPEQAMSLRYRP
jgi:hypothetical protein